MPWSAGTFTRTYGSTGWQGDAAAGTPIVADRHDTNDQDLATGINACLNKDGTNSMAANLNMGGFIPTNLGAGTAAAPAICAGNDQDTGMYSPAANQVGIATNGVERIRVNATGSLGIGTTSPGQLLDIGNGSSPAGLGIRLNGGTGNDSGGGIFFANSSTNNSAIGAYSSIIGGTQNNALTLWAGTGNEIRIITNGGANERMRIASTGNIAINTTSTSATFNVGGGSPAAAGGATNPGTVQINEQNITNLTTTGGLEFKGSSSGSGYGSKILGFDNGDLIFLNRNNSATWTESFRVKADSNRVGIGTGTPSYQLQLGSDSAAKPTTNTWTIASDERIKTNIQPYTKGLEAILQVEPITYDYNGKGGMAAGPGGISILAQALQPVFPECVGSYKGKLNEDDAEETDILNYNGHAMTFALINAVKELSSKLDALTERVEALEA